MLFISRVALKPWLQMLHDLVPGHTTARLAACSPALLWVDWKRDFLEAGASPCKPDTPLICQGSPCSPHGYRMGHWMEQSVPNLGTTKILHSCLSSDARLELSKPSEGEGIGRVETGAPKKKGTLRRIMGLVSENFQEQALLLLRTGMTVRAALGDPTDPTFLNQYLNFPSLLVSLTPSEKDKC